MKPTLFVLAAGMGSRYGGLKQLDEKKEAAKAIVGEKKAPLRTAEASL